MSYTNSRQCIVECVTFGTSQDFSTLPAHFTEGTSGPVNWVSRFLWPAAQWKHYATSLSDVPGDGWFFVAFNLTVFLLHYSDVMMSAIASQISSLTIVYSTVYSDADQRKYQRSASLAFVRGPVNSPHKGPVKRKTFPFDDVIINNRNFEIDIIRIAPYHLDVTSILYEVMGIVILDKIKLI